MKGQIICTNQPHCYLYTLIRKHNWVACVKEMKPLNKLFLIEEKMIWELKLTWKTQEYVERLEWEEKRYKLVNVYLSVQSHFQNSDLIMYLDIVTVLP